jgi:hypothetical protein
MRSFSRTLDKDTHEWGKRNFDYYFSEPYEAFADVTARLMYPSKDNDWQNTYFNTFSRTTSYLIGFMKEQGIPTNINGNTPLARAAWGLLRTRVSN